MISDDLVGSLQFIKDVTLALYGSYVKLRIEVNKDTWYLCFKERGMISPDTEMLYNEVCRRPYRSISKRGCPVEEG